MQGILLNSLHQNIGQLNIIDKYSTTLLRASFLTQLWQMLREGNAKAREVIGQKSNY
jgi:hypothetical protein